MNIGNSDERGDWARKFLSNEEFNELVARGDRFIAFDAEEIFFDVPPLTVNECLILIERWDDAMVRGNDEDFDFFHSGIQGFIDYLIVALEDIGITVTRYEDDDDDFLEFEDPSEED
jgi:hypothetical protein